MRRRSLATLKFVRDRGSQTETPTNVDGNADGCRWPYEVPRILYCSLDTGIEKAPIWEPLEVDTGSDGIDPGTMCCRRSPPPRSASRRPRSAVSQAQQGEVANSPPLPLLTSRSGS